MKSKAKENKKIKTSITSEKKTRLQSRRKSFFWQNFFYQIAYRLANSSAPEVAFVSSLILSRWWLNSDFSYPIELIIPIIMFGLLASVIYYLYRLIFGKGSAAHLAAIMLTYALYGYEFVYNTVFASTFLKIVPNPLKTDFTQSVVLAIALAILAGLIAFGIRWLIKHSTMLQRLQPYKVFLFAVVFIFSLQALRIVERYFEIQKEIKYQPAAVNVTKPENAVAGSKPDIYYLVFDRYTNEDVLNNNFNYDNTDLINYLSSNGFVTRDGAYSNYPFTTPSISSTMAMKYHDEFKDMFESSSEWKALYPYRTLLNDPPIAQVLKKEGYDYNQVSSWWDFTRIRVNADNNYAKSFRLNVFGGEFYLSDLQRDILHKSIYSPWLKKGVTIGDNSIVKYDLDRNPRENFDAQISSLKTISARADKSKPNFTFAHVLAPHPPYVFDEDGSWPEYDNEANDNGVPEKMKYTNELTYINGRIKDLMRDIRNSSPNAIIVMQADEGPYPEQFRGEMTAEHHYNPSDLNLDDMRQKFGILASYHMPGVSEEELKNLNSSVNLFPFILNHYLGYRLPMLPDCQFSMGNKYDIYDYTLISDKLKNRSADPMCSEYQ